MMHNFTGDYFLKYLDFKEDGTGLTFDGEQVKVTYIVMELAHISLYHLVAKQKKLTELAAHYVFGEILNALSAIHSKGFAHRDLKLDNILFTSHYKLKIIDFGYCSPDLESSSKSVGCDAFNPPEWHLNKPYNNKQLDLW